MLKSFLKSRTVWMIALNAVFNILHASGQVPGLDPHWVSFINAVTGLLAIYFRIAPIQSFPTPTLPDIKS